LAIISSENGTGKSFLLNHVINKTIRNNNGMLIYMKFKDEKIRMLSKKTDEEIACEELIKCVNWDRSRDEI
jgi:hypothetical protein